ncbi:MAG: amidohydrolase [Sulfitobacter sp.]
MSSYPEIIILNGTLITFDDATPDDATALAMAGGVITAVGPNAAMRDLAGPDTHVIDAQGGTVMPGFIDSHVHLFGGSVELSCLDLFGIQGGDALKAAIAPFAAANPDDRIVFAVQADYAILHDLRTPTRQELDQACPDRPFAMFAPDHHTIWANTAALELAGLLHGGETDAGSQIVMGDDGRATGELREPGAYAAILKLTRHGGRDMAGLVTGADPVPAPTRAEREKDKAAIARGMKHCAAQGITGLHCMDGNRYQLELLSEMEAEGTLLCRTAVPFHLKSYDSLDRLEQADTMRRDFSGDMVWCNHVKMFIDGVVEGRTAHMLAPYPGTDDNYGDPVFEVDHFNEACRRIDAMGMQIAVHAIGDAGIRHTIDGYEAARKANGARDSRHRIEHLEVMHPDDIPRLAELDIVASFQPGHAPFGGIFPPGGVSKYLHDYQIKGAYPWREIRDSGAKVVFSTDWPVIGVEVMTNVKAAIAPLDLGPQWHDQTQTLMETLSSYTRDNAWVEFNEDRKGKLAKGMMADVVIMSHDLAMLPPARITDAFAKVTICGGRVTHEAG